MERRMTDVNRDLNKKSINKELLDKLRPSLCEAPQFNELPTVDKADTPLKPIVSSIKSSAYNLAKFIASII